MILIELLFIQIWLVNSLNRLNLYSMNLQVGSGLTYNKLFCIFNNILKLLLNNCFQRVYFNEGSSFMPNINYTSNYDESYEYSNKSQSQLLITSCSQSSSSSTSFSCWSNASLDTGTSDWTLDSSINSSLNYSHLRKSVVRNKGKNYMIS